MGSDTRPRLALLFLLFILTFLWTVNTGKVGLWEPTEARYADIAWGMVATGDWWTPQQNYLVHFDKPAPAYWPPAAALRILGKRAWVPRISSLLLALLCVSLTYFWGRRLWGATGGLWAALILGTTLFYSASARVVSTDLPLCAAVILGQWAAWEILASGAGSHVELKKWPRLFWLSLGVGFAVKGPVALLLILLPALVFKAAARMEAGGRLRDFRWKEGILIFCCTGLPWYLSVCWRHPGLLMDLVHNHTLRRFFTTAHHREGPFYYYINILAGGFFPWIVVLGTAIAGDIRSAFKRDAGSHWALWCFSTWVPAFLIFSISGSKLPAYILPLFPIWSLQAAGFLIPGGSGPDNRREISGLVFGTGLLLALAGGFGMIFLKAPSMSSYLEESVRRQASIGAGLLIMGGLILFWLIRPPLRTTLRWLLVTAAAWSAASTVFALQLPAASAGFGAIRKIGETAAAYTKDRPGSKCAAYRCFPGSLPFYTDSPLITVGVDRTETYQNADLYRSLVLPRTANLDSLISAGAGLWIVKAHNAAEWKARLHSIPLEIGSEGAWKLYSISDTPSRSEDCSN